MTYEACNCDFDPPSIYRASTHKCRKPFVCEECSRNVPAGEAYEYVFGVFDGYACSFKTCRLCVELKHWAIISVPCFCFFHGNLHEDVRNMVREVRPDVPAGFFFEYGRRQVAINRAARFSRAH